MIKGNGAVTVTCVFFFLNPEVADPIQHYVLFFVRLRSAKREFVAKNATNRFDLFYIILKINKWHTKPISYASLQRSASSFLAHIENRKK